MVKIRDDFEGVTFVYDENATAHRLQAGDEVPHWATIGEHLAGGTAVDDAVESTSPALDPAANEAASAEAPKGNASREEWATFAASLGVQVPEDAKRDEIRALVDEHEKA